VATVGPPASPLAPLVEGVEDAFSLRHRLMVERLVEVETATDGTMDETALGVREQVAFIRVALRCIADAIGELAAHATALDAPPDWDDHDAGSEDRPA
jgi:hypothetical protein